MKHYQSYPRRQLMTCILLFAVAISSYSKVFAMHLLEDKNLASRNFRVKGERIKNADSDTLYDIMTIMDKYTFLIPKISTAGLTNQNLTIANICSMMEIDTSEFVADYEEIVQLTGVFKLDSLNIVINTSKLSTFSTQIAGFQSVLTEKSEELRDTYDLFYREAPDQCRTELYNCVLDCINQWWNYGWLGLIMLPACITFCADDYRHCKNPS